jgi:hypothetical protein
MVMNIVAKQSAQVTVDQVIITINAGDVDQALSFYYPDATFVSEAGEPAANCLDHDWDRMVSFYRYSKRHWVHLRTTNPIGSPFAAVR